MIWALFLLSYDLVYEFLVRTTKKFIIWALLQLNYDFFTSKTKGLPQTREQIMVISSVNPEN